MPYLERNARLLAEMGQTHRLVRDQIVGSGTFFYFTSTGSYHSTELGLRVFTGVKETTERTLPLFREDKIRDRLISELAIMSVIAENMPHLLPQLPLFHGLLVDTTGKALGIVTEDFSEGGINNVRGANVAQEEIKDLFEPGTIEADFFTNVGFFVYPPGKGIADIRLGDFYPFFRIRSMNQEDPNEDILQEEAIEADLEKYTVQVDYDL